MHDLNISGGWLFRRFRRVQITVAPAGIHPDNAKEEVDCPVILLTIPQGTIQE